MFQTKVQIPPSSLKMGYEDQMMTLGSCFAENIGKKMNDVYFDLDVNPFGVLYNPVSIKNSLELLLQNKPFSSDDLFEYHSLWNSFSHSTQFSNPDQKTCLDNINFRLESSAEFLKNTDALIITFGTAWIFEDVKSESVVSNCHKLPANQFQRRRLSVDEIVADYSELINQLTDQLPDLKLIFSVSPIRHWKDGAHENNISKSTLLLAIEELQSRFEQVHYFPAFEIQMDELRDYRFYASDMLHPSEVAVDYIWQRFSETYFNEQTLQIKSQLDQFNADMAHRPLHPESAYFQYFKTKLEERKAGLLARYKFLSTRID